VDSWNRLKVPERCCRCPWAFEEGVCVNGRRLLILRGEQPLVSANLLTSIRTSAETFSSARPISSTENYACSFLPLSNNAQVVCGKGMRTWKLPARLRTRVTRPALPACFFPRCSHQICRDKDYCRCPAN